MLLAAPHRGTFRETVQWYRTRSRCSMIPVLAVHSITWSARISRECGKSVSSGILATGMRERQGRPPGLPDGLLIPYLPARHQTGPTAWAGRGRVYGPGDLRPPGPSRRAGRGFLRAPAAAAREVRRGRVLLLPSGRAPRDPAGPGAHARHLPRRGHAAHPPHPPGALRLLPAALQSAAPDRGSLHARSPLARPLRLRGGPGHRPLRDGLLRSASPRDRGHLPGDTRGRPAGLDQRRPRAPRAEVHLSKVPDDPEAAPDTPPAALVRARPRGRRRVGRH